MRQYTSRSHRRESAYSQPLPLDEMLDAEDDDGDVDDFEEDSDGEDDAEPTGIHECSLQAITDAMASDHPWLNCRDIDRISVIGHPPSTSFRPSEHLSEEFRLLDEIPFTISNAAAEPTLCSSHSINHCRHGDSRRTDSGDPMEQHIYMPC